MSLEIIGLYDEEDITILYPDNCGELYTIILIGIYSNFLYSYL